MAIEFEGLDLAEAQKEYERVSAAPGAGGGEDYLAKYVRLPERDGFVMMRLMPRKKGTKLYCATRVHTLINPTTKKRRTYHCPRNLVQTDKGDRWVGECIVCKYYSDLWNKSESLSGKAQEDMQQAARAIKPVEKYYYNVIVRAERDKDGVVHKNVGPKIYPCGKTVHAMIMRAVLGDESAGEKALGDVTHPVNGRDFRLVKKVVKGGGGAEYPNYDSSKFEDVSPLGSPEDLQNWLAGLHDLQAQRVVKNPDELKHALRVHLGMVKEGEGQEGDELDEFRNAGSSPPPPYNPPAQRTPPPPPEPVRDDLLVSPPPPPAANNRSVVEDTLADDDFMRELEGM